MVAILSRHSGLTKKGTVEQRLEPYEGTLWLSEGRNILEERSTGARRTSGRNVPEIFKEQPGGHSDWSRLCKGEKKRETSPL